jgi:hypothetical protein
MGEVGRAVTLDMLVEPDAGAGLGQDGCERGLAQLPRRSNGSFCFPNFDLKSTRTLPSQLDSKPEVCRDDGMAPSHIPVEGGLHG